MSNFPTNFPLGKSIWIWNLEECLAGNLSAIIQKCKDNGINTLIIKGADGVYGWSQFTQELVDQIHTAGLKIFSWSYCYGADPTGEANLINALLDHGVDGHVIDAESEYEHLPNPASAVTVMMNEVRAKHPNSFIVYAPFPIIDDHMAFPYIEFNKYCQAVMPQVYWNDFQMTPANAINWMFSQWEKWQTKWKDANLSGSNLPLIPLGSFYDITPSTAVPKGYTLTPADIAEFISSAAGYMAISIWEFAHIIRPDCWNAIKINNVKSENENTVVPTSEQNQQNTNPVTPVSEVPKITTVPAPLTEAKTFIASQLPADINNSMNGAIKTFNGQQVTVRVNSDGTRTLTPYPSKPVESPTMQDVAKQAQTPTVATTSPATRVQGLPLASPIAVPAKGKTTITIKKDPTAPQGVAVKVHDKVLIDYIEEFFGWLSQKLFHRG